MIIATKAIVFSSLKYGDTSLIVKMYTASSGLKSYMVKGVLASKKGKMKTAYFQPLMQLEIIANHRDKGGLETLREVKVGYPYQTVHTDMAKNALILFLAEVLRNSIYEEEPNEGLFHFVEASLQWLDTHDTISNFHLFFLLSLTRYLGFYPDTHNTMAPYFDLVEGRFANAPSLNPVLSGTPLRFFKLFLKSNFEGMHTIKMDKTNRQELLNSFILYFEFHLQGFGKPKSLVVLNQVFN